MTPERTQTRVIVDTAEMAATREAERLPQYSAPARATVSHADASNAFADLEPGLASALTFQRSLLAMHTALRVRT